MYVEPCNEREEMISTEKEKVYEDVYATLLLNDFYLPGALVLAHSLRDAGTTKKLAVLFTPETVSASALKELQSSFDHVIPVVRIVNEYPTNLELMNRPDLSSTFTKILLWKQSQFRKIVYVDSDIIALRAPDELFDLPHAFSAAPDIGWPDIFNSGLMVLTPNMADYEALLSMALKGISFDGADQGLLNMHFGDNFNRLSFTYNVTPSAHYQYLPAYRHFESKISMVHFIGNNKPWSQCCYVNDGSSPFNEMIEKWWTIYNRHYNEISSGPEDHIGEETVVDTMEKGGGEDANTVDLEKAPEESRNVDSASSTTLPCQVGLYSDIQPGIDTIVIDEPIDVENSNQHQQTSETIIEEQKQDQFATNVESSDWDKDQYSTWNASKEPPPVDSRPEALNFPRTQYSMSSDPALFKAPDRYPDPPKNMWYEVPKTPTYQRPSPIFPWENNSQKPSRVFAEDFEEPSISLIDSIKKTESSHEDEDNEPIENVEPVDPTPIDQWQTYSRKNAWDEIPGIRSYVGSLQRKSRESTYVSKCQESGSNQKSVRNSRGQGMKLTDFPIGFERASLPVTPAPIKRPNFWGEDKQFNQLPAAEGVPSQEEWDPTARLEKLVYQQAELLERRLK